MTFGKDSRFLANELYWYFSTSYLCVTFVMIDLRLQIAGHLGKMHGGNPSVWENEK